MSKQRLSNLADNYSHLNHRTWQCAWVFFHKIKQSRINCRLRFTEGSQLHADARLSLLIWRHIQYVNRVKNWFVTHNKWFPLLSTRNRVAECAHLAGTTAAEFLEPPQFWGLITPHLQQPAQVSLCHPFPFQGVTDMVPRRPSDRPDQGWFVCDFRTTPPIYFSETKFQFLSLQWTVSYCKQCSKPASEKTACDISGSVTHRHRFAPSTR